MTADATYLPKIQRRDNGDTLAVASGGTLDIESGGVLSIAGTDKASAIAAAVTTPVAGVAASYKAARGETALDGGNPTSVAHGLTTCVSFVATLKGTAAPGVGTSILTANINGANVDVYAWKVTSSIDNTLVASTGTESFYWVAVGT